MSDISLIKQLTEAFGPCGLEDEVTTIIYDFMSKYSDKCGYSPMGGVYAVIKGSNLETGAKLLSCGIDEVSFMVGDIDDDAFVRPKKLTKFNAGSICSKKVIVGSEKGKFEGVMSAKVLHLASGGDRENPNIDKCFIDLGFTKKDEIADKIEKGDFITYNEKTESFGKDKLIGKALNSRVGAALMMEYAKYMKENNVKPSRDIIFYFSVKEKAGMSDLFYGIRKFAPEKAMVLSALPAVNSDEKSNCKIGEGIALPTHDNFSLYFGNEIYKNITVSDIKYQIPKNVDEGQPSASAQCGGAGCKMINISLPVRNLFSSGEIVSLSDIKELEKTINYFVTDKI